MTSNKAPLLENSIPAIIFRLSDWQIKSEDIEPGYVRPGYGYRENMSPNELMDSVRAWWLIKSEDLVARGIEHVVASFRTETKAVYQINEIFGREEDERCAFKLTQIKSGRAYDDYYLYQGLKVITKKGDQSEFVYWPPSK
jgi:hypothetical protein